MERFGINDAREKVQCQALQDLHKEQRGIPSAYIISVHYDSPEDGETTDYLKIRAHPQVLDSVEEQWLRSVH